MLSSDGQQQLPGLIEAALADYRKSLAAACKRIGVKVVAFYLPGENGERLKPESLLNQLRDWNHRKHPSADAGFVAQHLDVQHALEVAALSGRVIGLKPMFKPVDSLRALAQRAGKGFISAAELNEILSQTAMEEP